MSVHYKFKSALSFDTITFDGLHISIKDLKKAILQQKQIGKASDFDLQITNAQSNEVYEDESTLVPKNSSLIVVRVPLTTQQKKSSEKSDVLPALGKGAQDGLDPAVNKLAKTVDLTNVDASEADKIQAAITQSTLEYDPSNYLRIKGSNQVGELPANYRCYKCLQPGHWIRDCKLNSQPDSSVDIKKSTGIPRSFMVPVEGPEVPGAMMTPTGHFAVPSIEHEARKEPLKKLKEPVVVEKPVIPNDLMCGVCKDLLTDAVLIPCCGNSFCDECIRNVLLESEDHQCPDCREKDVSPDTLIPNRFLRNSVNAFRNKTGYVKVCPVKTAAAPPEKPPSPKVEAVSEKLPAKNSHLEDGELEIVEESSSNVGQPSGSIPSLTNPPPIADPTVLPTNFEQGSNPVENLLPIPNLAVNSRSQPNYISHKGDETSHYIKKEKIYNNRHERSGTPTIDENRYRIESLGGMQPRMAPPMQQPMLYPHEKESSSRKSSDSRSRIKMHVSSKSYMYHQRPPQYIPPRPDMTPYPPGVDDPNMIRMPQYGHRLPYNHRPRAPYSMSHNGNNQPGNRTKRRSRSISRSYSRSPSPKRYRGRSRSLRSRTRTRSRSPRSRTRSRSRSAYIRKRSRSRSFSMSRSPYSERSGNRSLSRERHFSPSRRRDYRHSPNYRASPHRYYSKKYKEEYASHSLKVPERRSRHVSKQDYYTPDYPRRTDRYDSRYKERDRDHEKNREREKERHHRKYDELDAREIAKQAGLDLRAKVADDWEKTRDRELELRKKEAQQQLYSLEKSRKDLSQVETIESTSREELRPPGVADEDRNRVLVNVHCDEVKETSKSPEKDKKKEKKKKKKEEVDRKKKKKKKDKKDEEGEDTSKNLYEDEVKLDQEIIQKYTEIPKEEKDVVLAPLPELSKWEKDEETAPSEENKKPSEESKVTSEVIKRAENAIFKKIHIKPIDAKKPERRVKLAEKEEIEEKPEKKEKERRKNDKEERAPRSVALPVEKERKDMPQRISAKERLGAKVDDKVVIKPEIRERREIKVLEKKPKEKIEIKKLSEENFEPDYEKEEEVKEEPKKRSLSPEGEPELKKIKEEKAKSSSPESSLSSDDSDKHHKKRKKSKKHKKRRKKKKHGSSSDSDSSTSSSDSESEKKKRRHKHKSHKKSKKRKKSKK